MFKIDRLGNRIVVMTVMLVALAGLLVSAASYVHTRSLAGKYDKAMQTELQQKGLAYGQTTQSLLNAVASSSPQAFQSLLSESISSPDAIITKFSGGASGDFQDTPLGYEAWAQDPSALGGYKLLFRRILSAERSTTAEDPGIRPLVARTAATGEPSTSVDEGDRHLHYSFLIQLDAQTKLIVVATLDASQEFAFISKQRHRAIRDAIFFAVGSIVFVSLVGGGLSLLVSRTLTNRKRAEEALRDGELRYRTLASLAPVGIFRNDAEGNNIYNNQQSLDLLGVSATASAGWADSLHPEDRDRVLAEWGEAIAHAAPFRSQYRFVRPDGSVVWVLGQVAPERNVHGTVVGYVGTVTDITEQKQMEQGLRESEEKFRSVAEAVAAGIFILQGTTVRYVNPGVETITGYGHDELLSMPFFSIIHPEFRQLILERSKARQSGENVPMRSEAKIIRKNGEERWVDFSARLIEYEEQPALLGTAFDITDQKRAEEMLREQARRDWLTGVLNHAGTVEELRKLIGSDNHERFAVAMIDVDSMKAMNDTYGHVVGDQALQTVARLLSRRGAIVGRYGGDEFVVVLPGADRQAVEQYTREVADALRQAPLTEPDTGGTVPLAATIGFALYPEEAETIVDLIKLADSAMYAQRRQRPIAPGVRPRRSRTDDSAARLVGEIVPLLTSPGDIRTKLHFVAHRLLVGLGYDAVSTVLFALQPGGPALSSTVARVDNGLLQAWDEDQAQEGEASTLRALLEQVQRPFIIDDLASDARLSSSQRELLGRADLRSGLVVPMIWQNHTLGALAVGSKQAAVFGAGDAQLLSAVAAQVTAIVRMSSLVEELQDVYAKRTKAHEATVLLLAAAAEAHDGATGQHLQRMQALVEVVARELEYPGTEAESLGLAAVLHDIGKLFVSETVLTSAGPLDDAGWELMKRHTTLGQDFLTGHAGFELAAMIARHHHERWDGGGYPDGLAGEQIPEPAAIVCVADAFDAMTSGRPYAPPVSLNSAVAEIRACSGTQFNPRVVEALLRLHERGALPSTPPFAQRAAA